MTSPTVSVIIPICNGAAYIRETLASVFAQTRPPTEIIVVDDGSTDDSATIARSFPGVTVIAQANAGANAARNCGVAFSRGDFLAFLDQDDLWAADKLAWQLATFRAEPELDFVYGHVEQFFSKELPAEQRRRLVIANQILPGIHVGTLLARRASFLKVGQFQEDRDFAHFAEWYARSLDLNMRQAVIEQTVMRRRIHGNNMTLRDGIQAKQAFTQSLKAVLDRRRAKAGQASPPGRNT